MTPDRAQPDAFSITSPGPLVSGVTLENILTHRSKPRNRTLARAASLLGIAEEVGRGVDRMYREMIRSGRDVPRIEGDFDEVRVSLTGTAPDTSVARYVATLPDSERDDTDAMLVLLHLLRRRTVTADEVAPVLQRHADQAETVLRRLEAPAVRMIEPTRQTAGRRRRTYRFTAQVLKELGASVPYRRRTTDEIDRKIIAHVREYDRITNRTGQICSTWEPIAPRQSSPTWSPARSSSRPRPPSADRASSTDLAGGSPPSGG